ncbi:MAG: alkaline phosphatase D family protein [Burkholderiaceae bacterium]
MAEHLSALSAEAPLIRSESAPDPEGGRVHVLTALRPEQGWPRLWAWLPVRLREADWRVEALGEVGKLEQGLRIQPFDRGALDIGEPLRQPLPLDWFPPAADGQQEGLPGLLGLFIYAHPQALSLEGGNEALLSEPDLRQLCQVLRARLDRGGPELALGFVPTPAEPGGEQGLSFLLAACQYPPGVLDHSPDALARPDSASPAEAALARMVAFCRRTPAGRQASLLLLAGDQIYADASSGLFDANNRIDRYAKPYMAFRSSVIRHLPPSLAKVVHLPDDHEVQDNWEPIAEAAEPLGPLYAGARQAAWTHRWDPLPGPAEPAHFWHSFDWRGAAFFIGDSRLERQPRRADRWREAQLISPAQREALYRWLDRTQGRPRFVVTSALLLPRRLATKEHAASALRSDAWDGFPASLHGLLGELWARRADGVVFLSGDEHRSGFVSARIEPADGQGPALRLHSIHSSGLFTPWRFAVTNTEDFAAPECFSFPGPGGRLLRCSVSAWSDHPGNGFAVLRLRGGRLELWFDRAGRALHHAADPLPAPDGSLDLGLGLAPHGA